MNSHKIIIEIEQCIGCGACIKDCPQSNIVMENKVVKLVNETCLFCGHCYAICPQNAIAITGFKQHSTNIEHLEEIHPQSLLSMMAKRRSIRQFQNKTVPSDVIEQIIEAGRCAPTAENSQNVTYMILDKDKEQIELIALSFFRKLLPFASIFRKGTNDIVVDEHFLFKKAPCIILVLSKGQFAKENGTLAASNMSMVCEVYGLGVLYSGFFTMIAKYNKRLRRALGIGRKDVVVAAMVIGYPAIRYARVANKEEANIQYR